MSEIIKKYRIVSRWRIRVECVKVFQGVSLKYSFGLYSHQERNSLKYFDIKVKVNFMCLIFQILWIIITSRKYFFDWIDCIFIIRSNKEKKNHTNLRENFGDIP